MAALRIARLSWFYFVIYRMSGGAPPLAVEILGEIRKVEAEADKIIERARADAKRIVADAHARAEQLLREAVDKARVEADAMIASGENEGREEARKLEMQARAEIQKLASLIQKRRAECIELVLAKIMES